MANAHVARVAGAFRVVRQLKEPAVRKHLIQGYPHIDVPFAGLEMEDAVQTAHLLRSGKWLGDKDIAV